MSTIFSPIHIIDFRNETNEQLIVFEIQISISS